MMTRRFALLFLLFTVFFLVSSTMVLSGPPRFDAPLVLSDRSVGLRLTGDSGSAFAIEASQNLSNWFFVVSGIETNGVLSLHHAAATNYPALFYRAKGVEASLPPLTVGPKLNTNATVSALAGQKSSSARLFRGDGTRFTLNLPSNSIPDATIITMTLVTNITGLPFARGMLGAVQLDPPNLALWNAASLEILFPTNVSRREVISYFCEADGSSFQLTPDRVGTNRILIPVTHLGTYGSSLCTTQELATAARIETGDGQPLSPELSRATAPGILSAAVASSCFPEEQLVAQQISAQIAKALAAKSQANAAVLGAARQQAQANESDDSSTALEQVAASGCAFYKDQIAPQWALAEVNCPLAKFLLQNTLALDRQAQLLGGDSSDSCVSIANAPLCTLFKTCLGEVRACCATGIRGTKKITEVLNLERQDQLLGVDCISQAEAQEVIDLCSSNLWSGTFSMDGVSKRVMTTNPFPATVVTDTVDFHSHFEGVVEESNESGEADVGFVVELRLLGQLVHRDFHNTTIDSSTVVDRCPDDAPGGTDHRTQISEKDQNIGTQTRYLMSFFIFPFSGYQFLHAENIDSGDPNWVTATGTLDGLEYDAIDRACGGTELLKNQTLHFSKSPLVAVSLPENSGSMSDPNTVSGTFTFDDPIVDPPARYVFKWSFTRRSVAP